MAHPAQQGIDPYQNVAGMYDAPASPTSSSSSFEGDVSMNGEHARFYYEQQQQAILYQQHHLQNGLEPGAARQAAKQARMHMDDDSDDGFSDEESDTDSMPDDSIDFSLTYALHTFLATVEGQASVVKGDSLVLLDDANSYWWLVRVLKTEDVGYIPAENIETPYERLARLNKHRNIDLAAATKNEKQLGQVQSREKLKGAIAAKGRNARQGSNEGSEESSGRRVIFAPPTYVDHPGVTWSSDEEDTDHEPEEVEMQEDEHSQEGHDPRHAQEAMDVDDSMDDMEPDDGVEWADEAAEKERQKVLEQRQAAVTPKSNNPFAPQSNLPAETVSNGVAQSSSTSSLNSASSPILDPASASDTRRITATPAVAGGPLLPSAVVNGSQNRNVSGQSTSSVYSTVSATSSVRSSTPTGNSPEDAKNKMKKPRKSDDNGEKKKKGLLGGLFSRNKADKKGKGISSADQRSSEDSALEDRGSEDDPSTRGALAASGLHESSPQNASDVSSHSLKLQQADQARMQSYTQKYLKSPNDQYSASNAEAAAAVAQSAAAMRLSASVMGTSNGQNARPSSIIVSPNPDGPPLLNVIRIFAGTQVDSEASFKTALINETTSAGDLIRQAIQRFHLQTPQPQDPLAGYYVTVKDFDGTELELDPQDKPLGKFQAAVARWSESEVDEHGKLQERLGAITPTVKRDSVSSISSMASLSNHPAIKKLGMDWEDDSQVKLYLNRRLPVAEPEGMPDPQSGFSSYSTGLSTAHESPKSDEDMLTPGPSSPVTAKNPNLTISTGAQAAPERYMSPSARFTLQLLLYPADLPPGIMFDPSSESLVARPKLQQGVEEGEARKRLFTLPRNANVVDVIEQGLERFGVQEGVVDGGDEVEDKVGKRRSMTRVRYSLGVIVNGQGQPERQLSSSSKILESYPSAPILKPMEKSTPESRRRSRDLSYNVGSTGDIRESDPIFVLRKVGARGLAGAKVDGIKQTPTSPIVSPTSSDPRSPQEIIAAQRAASRSHQMSVLSSTNKGQGVDVRLPETQGTFRSTRQVGQDGGAVIRYSFIDEAGETYDISELLEAEVGKDGKSKVDEVGDDFKTGSVDVPPELQRQGTDMSVSDYHTAPSTPEPGMRTLSGDSIEIMDEPRPRSRSAQDRDILQRAVQRASQDGEAAGLHEALQRVADKAREGSTKGSTGPEEVARERNATPNGRITPEQDSSEDLHATPRASNAYQYSEHDHSQDQSTRTNSRQATRETAASVNRIISRHRQQPSIASIMSDFDGDKSGSSLSRDLRDRSVEPPSSVSEGDENDRLTDPDGSYNSSSTGYEANFNDRSSTPATASSSTHPTPPFNGNGGMFTYTRAVNVASPTPRAPVRYRDDFGMKDMMAVIRVRAREYRSATKPKTNSRKNVRGSVISDVDSMRSSTQAVPGTEVDRQLFGEKIDWEEVHPEIRDCLHGVQERLDSFDREVDDLLATVGALGI
ncbi:hypothetical protein I350_04305 [Cryptococcus amylolentus CBS 6273]|uniref:SH3 domain-containing protein n=1 Tax=Cryptococcus amylolentus CBS 6273 TaxID=1296118 RepID=A0A1E3K1B5_9TREE|nr:hypothetical protein I350_04305 [Cryptococcus amylolentus CBS 6273]